MKSLRKDLDTWLSTAPPIQPRSDALSIFAQKEWFELNHNYSVLFLYRSMIANKNTHEDIFRECFQAAAGICHEYRRQYIGRPLNYTWGSVYTIFLAGLTYLHCLWMSPAIRENTKFHEISSTCTDCLIVLVVMAERWKGAASYRDILDTLANRTMAAVSEAQAQGKVESPSLGAGVPGSGGLYHYMTEIEDFDLLDGVDRFFMDFIGDTINDGSAQKCAS